MRYRGHVIGGVLAAGTIIYVMYRKQTIQPVSLASGLILGGSLLGASFCDIDLPTSKIGSKLTLVSKFLHKTVGHRTLTHSLPLAILLFYGLHFLNMPMAIGFFAGMCSHILLDMIGKKGKGVACFYPFYKKRIHFF